MKQVKVISILLIAFSRVVYFQEDTGRGLVFLHNDSIKYYVAMETPNVKTMKTDAAILE